MDARDRLLRPEGDMPVNPVVLRRTLPTEEKDQDVVESRCFAFTRGLKDRPTLLTLKAANGNECSIEWTWAPDVVYVPGHATPLTLVLSSRGFKVEIFGTNLRLLAVYLQQRRVVWIKAQDALHHAAFHAAAGADDRPGFVEGFRVLPLGQGEDLQLLQRALHGPEQQSVRRVAPEEA